MLEHHALTERIVGLAIDVHRGTGPGPLQSVDAACLAFELEQAGFPVLQQAGIPVINKGVKMSVGFRADPLVANTVTVEIRALPGQPPRPTPGCGRICA